MTSRRIANIKATYYCWPYIDFGLSISDDRVTYVSHGTSSKSVIRYILGASTRAQPDRETAGQLL